jgi:hypothetical protein
MDDRGQAAVEPLPITFATMVLLCIIVGAHVFRGLSRPNPGPIEHACGQVAGGCSGDPTGSFVLLVVGVAVMLVWTGGAYLLERVRQWRGGASE